MANQKCTDCDENAVVQLDGLSFCAECAEEYEEE